MLCAVYKTRKKDGMYLYVPKKDHFEDVPLMAWFGAQSEDYHRTTKA